MGISTGIGLMALGTGFSAVGQQQAGKAEAENLKFNQQVAGGQAQDAIARGEVEERRYRTSIRQLIGEQRASMSAQGLDVSFGSALDLQLDVAYYGELDALTIRNNAAREAWGYRMQGAGYAQEAVYAERAGTMSAFSTLLGGGTDVYLFSRGLNVPATQRVSKG